MFPINPKNAIVKNWLIQLTEEYASQHEQIAERITAAMVTNKDLEDFGKFLSIVYHCGYRKAFNEYKQQAEKMGFKLVFENEPKSESQTHSQPE